MEMPKEKIEERLNIVKEIAASFRPNTNIDTVIRHYESILKEIK